MRPFSLLLSVLFAQSVLASDLNVDFRHDQAGILHAALYRAADGFTDQDKAVYKIKQDTAKEGSQMIVRNLPPGQYAIKAFLDLNRNGQLDKNLLGMPKEPYGYSNNARAQFGPPSVGAATFEQKTMSQSLTIQLD